MTYTQPTLFTEPRQEPVTCPRCGETEPNEYLLEMNHGIDPGADTISGAPRGEHPIYGDRCVAQDLVSNHIHYDVIHGHDDELARDVARGRQLGLDTDAIIAAARALPAPSRGEGT